MKCNVIYRSEINAFYLTLWFHHKAMSTSFEYLYVMVTVIVLLFYCG